MKILFCGDVVGKSGRVVLKENILKLKISLGADLVICNGENAAHGFGITDKICREFFDEGVDVITLGNHSFDNSNIIDYINNEPRLIRPVNYLESSGKGFYIAKISGLRVMVINLLGGLFMSSKIEYKNPFHCIYDFLEVHKLGDCADIIIVDFHAEATSEKCAMGLFLDGKVSAVFGTHTHIPTSDARILPNGTGFQTDVGMCGDYLSVIGMDKEAAISSFSYVEGDKRKRLVPANHLGTISGCFIEIDDITGKCEKISQVFFGEEFKKERNYAII